MLINALCEYENLRAKTDSTSEGWENQPVHYRIILSPDGRIASIVDIPPKKPYKIYDKKGKEKIIYNPQEILLPKRTQKPGIESNYVEHRALYIFGLNYDKESGKFTPEDKTDKAKKSHSAFVKHELEFMDGLDSPVCNAYRNFIESWVPENETENPELMKLGKNIENAYFAFALGVGRLDFDLHDDAQLKEKYNAILSAETKRQSESANTAVCEILGQRLPVARLHDKVAFPSGQPSGSQLISMNDTAFESYGKTQSYNSNVSELAMKQYTSALKYLLGDPDHHIIIGKMTVIFFAMKENDTPECVRFVKSTSGVQSSLDSTSEGDIKGAGEHIKSGVAPDTERLDSVDKNVTFYIAGFTPNGPRICQKFFLKDSFGNIVKNLQKHQDDLRIREDSKRQIYFSGIKKELLQPKKGSKSDKSSNDDVPPPLMSSIMHAAFTGSKYPDGMLATVIERIKRDSDDDKNKFIKLNDTRAGMIKACLVRKHREEVITMSWNKENKNPAYLCGGLFAIYEKIQRDSVEGTLNTTIKDSYFSSACSRPSVVFPKLARLSNNHMRKLDTNATVFYSKMIQELVDGLDGEFPKTLSLDDQGRFIIGYYQMNQKLYTSNKKDERTE